MTTWLRRRRIPLLLLALCYLLFTMFGGCADKLVLFPQPSAPEFARGAKQKLLPFQSGHLEIYTARTPSAAATQPAAYILSFCGNAALAEHAGPIQSHDWAQHPIEVWTVNHPGFGNSTGPATLARMDDAALAAYDALKLEAGDKPIFLFGYSIGSTMALHIAANRPAAGLFLRTPPPLRQLILQRHGWWNLWLLAAPVALGIPSELDSLANARRCSAPALFFFIEADNVVPIKYQRMVQAAYAGPTRSVTLSTGDHNSPIDDIRDDLREAMTWLWQQGTQDNRHR